jgi:hypothetical protein
VVLRLGSHLEYHREAVVHDPYAEVVVEAVSNVQPAVVD